MTIIVVWNKAKQKNMQINIDEVTFNTAFAPKNVGSRTFLKTLGDSYYQQKKEKLLLNPWNIFLQGRFY